MLVENVDDALVVEVARGVVRQVAPQEMPLFRANSEVYLKDPPKALRGTRGGDQMLGFGAGIEVELLTPIVLTVVSEVVKFVAAEVAKSAKREGSTVIDEQVKRLFSRFRTADKSGATVAGKASDDPPPLTHEQLARVRTIAFEAARRLQLSADQANLLADSTVGGLAVA